MVRWRRTSDAGDKLTCLVPEAGTLGVLTADRVDEAVPMAHR